MSALSAGDQARPICEDILFKDKTYNLEHNIWPSENVVIDRLFAQRLELVDAYAEIHKKLHARAHGIKSIFDIVVNVAALP